MKEEKIIIVKIEDEGIRIDRFLRQNLGEVSQSLIEKLLRKGDVRINNAKAITSARLKENDTVLINNFALKLITLAQQNPMEKKLAPEYKVTPEDIDLIEKSIIWEDENVFVLNKPHKIAVQGGTKTPRHLDVILKTYGQEKGETYRLVHRLDQNTTGVILFAKNLKTAQYYTSLFKNYKDSGIEKKYWAIVAGNPVGIETITAPLSKGKEGGDKEKMYVDPEKGKKAVTNLRILKKLDHYLYLVELSPLTGRTHQIRVHCAYINCPIVGDGKYGGKEVLKESADMQLHARVLSVKDPEGHRFNFTAEMPDHMVSLLKKHKVHVDKL